MAIFRIITFLIKAIVGAVASLLVAVFTHVVPAIVAVVALLALAVALCGACGFGGLAFLRKRARSSEDA